MHSTIGVRMRERTHDTMPKNRREYIALSQPFGSAPALGIRFKVWGRRLAAAVDLTDFLNFTILSFRFSFLVDRHQGLEVWRLPVYEGKK